MLLGSPRKVVSRILIPTNLLPVLAGRAMDMVAALDEIFMISGWVCHVSRLDLVHKTVEEANWEERDAIEAIEALVKAEYFTVSVDGWLKPTEKWLKRYA